MSAESAEFILKWGVPANVVAYLVGYPMIANQIAACVCNVERKHAIILIAISSGSFIIHEYFGKNTSGFQRIDKLFRSAEGLLPATNPDAAAELNAPPKPRNGLDKALKVLRVFVWGANIAFVARLKYISKFPTV